MTQLGTTYQRIRGKYYTLTYAATIDIDFALSLNFQVTLEGNPVLTFSNLGVANGKIYCVRFIQDATGGRVPTYPATFKPPGDIDPTLSSAANKIDLLTLRGDGTNMEQFGFAQTVGG